MPSIVQLDSDVIAIGNSGYTDNEQENKGGLFLLDLSSRALIEVYNSSNTNTLGGFDGVFNSNWTSNYSVINDIKLYNNRIWILNPFNELYGDIVSKYNTKTYNWSGVNVSTAYNLNDISSLYNPQSIAFDSNGVPWVSFSYTLVSGASNQIYSNGGIRYVNDNNQLQRIDNSQDLIGGENSDVWSMDICDYNGLDVMWIVSSDGVQGYTIQNKRISAILPTDFFIDLPFDAGDKIKCDSQSNVWISTKHSGVRVLLSNQNYTEAWPSFYGITNQNSGLLSDIVYDFDFNNETGEVYFATEMGICILEAPFASVNYKSNDSYTITFDKNPFLVPKDDLVAIGNIPPGSTLKVMNLQGKVLAVLKEQNYTIYSWDGRDSNGNYLRSGVYLVASFNEGSAVSVGKLAIIREE